MNQLAEVPEREDAMDDVIARARVAAASEGGLYESSGGRLGYREDAVQHGEGEDNEIWLQSISDSDDGDDRNEDG